MDDTEGTTFEAEAGVKFVKIVQQAFPSVALLSDLPKYLRETAGGLRNRVIKCPRAWSGGTAAQDLEDNNILQAFEVVRTQMEAVTTLLKAVPPRGPDVRFSGKYSSNTFDKLEIDYLVKLPAGLGEWARDPSAPEGDVFFLTPRGTKYLPERDSPLPELPSESPEESDDPPSSERPSGLGDSKPPPASPGAPAAAMSSRDTAYTRENYPPRASQYVIAEVCAPAEGGDSVVQDFRDKLVQMERIIRFLMAKEGKVNVRDVVQGVMFMGPAMTPAVAKALVKAIMLYQDALACLAELIKPPHRVLGVSTPRFQSALAVFSLSLSVEALRGEMESLRGEMRAENRALQDEMRAENRALRDEMRSLVDMMRLVREDQVRASRNRCAVS